MKNEYKKVKSLERKFKSSFLKTDIITMIINLKSSYGNIYRNPEIKKQLLYILKGTKGWTGDVKRYFWVEWNKEVIMPSHIRPYYGHRYTEKDPNYYAGNEDELPF